MTAVAHGVKICKSRVVAAVSRLTFGLMLIAFLLAPLSLAAEGEFRSVGPDISMGWPEALWAHPDYGLEWWYFTGHLSDGRDWFGFELTFFRVGINREPARESFSVRDVYLAHFALSDTGSKTFKYFERSSRGAFQEAGALARDFRVWNGGWLAEGGENEIRLKATEGDISLDLTLSPAKKPVRHGHNGYSQKGGQAGDASYYLSLTRLSAEGTIRSGGGTKKVTGRAWMDREISTPVKESEVAGWDWFGIQLDNGRDLMLYRIYRKDGSLSPFSAGTLVASDGETTALGSREFQARPLSSWESPLTGIAYDVSWELDVPAHGLKLKVAALIDGQELATRKSTGNSYWEGACIVSGTDKGAEISGRAYLEMFRQGLTSGSSGSAD